MTMPTSSRSRTAAASVSAEACVSVLLKDFDLGQANEISRNLSSSPRTARACQDRVAGTPRVLASRNLHRGKACGDFDPYRTRSKRLTTDYA
jgi:hypothetical protein